MCGITGILTNDSGLDLEAALLRMRAAMLHRGPDGEGQQTIDLPDGRRLGLAHTRLAILDLSSAGHQPMEEPASGSWIVYNGETYNHLDLRTRHGLDGCVSTSDTESVLKLWVKQGTTALEEMRGMFACAVYDARRQQLVLARDRLGIKPLYIGYDGTGTWIFASEIRAILASGIIPESIRREALQAYFTFGAVPAPWTMLESVESLLPAESWTFDLSEDASNPKPRRHVYWQPRFCSHTTGRPNRTEHVQRLRESLLEATRLRMLSDVPVGVFLSGGIDSSAVVAALAHQGESLRTFAVTFEDQAFSEAAHSRTVAEHFGTEHTELRLSSNDVLQQLDTALGAYDQPSIDGVNTFFISQCVRQAGLKVALSGLGGDELFCGYPSFHRLARLESTIVRTALRLVQLCGGGAGRSVRGQKLRDLLINWQSPLVRCQIVRELMSPARVACLLQDGPAADRPLLPIELQRQLSAGIEELDVIDTHSRLEMALYMANMLLRDTDQMSMAHGLEVRVPLLDHHVVEDAIRLPGHMRLETSAGYGQKAMLLEALPTALPESVWRRRKMGFVFPWERWLRQELRDRTAQVITDASTWERLNIDTGEVRQIWDEFLQNRRTVRYTDVLSLLHLAAWSQHLGVTVASRRSAQPRRWDKTPQPIH